MLARLILGGFYRQRFQQLINATFCRGVLVVDEAQLRDERGNTCLNGIGHAGGHVQPGLPESGDHLVDR
jgi:hypothetical protein